MSNFTRSVVQNYISSWGNYKKRKLEKLPQHKTLLRLIKRILKDSVLLEKYACQNFCNSNFFLKKGYIVEISEDSPLYNQQKSFDNQLLEATSKYAYSLNDGKIVGQHEGAHFFTKGQRKGLAVRRN